MANHLLEDLVLIHMVSHVSSLKVIQWRGYGMEKEKLKHIRGK
jgi:hypothetical protein